MRVGGENREMVGSRDYVMCLLEMQVDVMQNGGRLAGCFVVGFMLGENVLMISKNKIKKRCISGVQITASEEGCLPASAYIWSDVLYNSNK